MDVEVSARLDGELDEARAERLEAEIASDPLLRAQVGELRGAASALRSMVDEAEAKVDFQGFSAGVMAAIDAQADPKLSEPEAREQLNRGAAGQSRQTSLWGRVRGGLSDLFAAHRPALAAAATMLVILGGGSFYFLISGETVTDLQSPVILQGGSTVIEDLTFGDSSAVVFRTDSDVTVIWVTED